MTEPTDKPFSGPRTQPWTTWAVAALLVAVAGFCLARGMPWANGDDVFFIGASMDLAHTGQLTNHFLRQWMTPFRTQKFFVRMPLPSYLLAGWIRVFGVGTVSFLTYQWVWYAVGGHGLVRLLGRFGLSMAVRLGAVLINLNGSLQTGLRPEAQASGLLFLGLSLVHADAGFGRRFVAVSLLGLSIVSYPITAAVAAPFAVALLFLQRPQEQPVRVWLRQTVRAWLLPGGAAAGLVLLTFLAMIHFEPGLFWRVFETHRLSRALPEGPARSFLRLITEYNEAALTLPVVVLLMAAGGFALARGKRIAPETRVLACAALVAVAGCVWLYSVRASGWALLFSFCVSCPVVAGTAGWRRYRPLLMGAILALFA